MHWHCLNEPAPLKNHLLFQSLPAAWSGGNYRHISAFVAAFHRDLQNKLHYNLALPLLPWLQTYPLNWESRLCSLSPYLQKPSPRNLLMKLLMGQMYCLGRKGSDEKCTVLEKTAVPWIQKEDFSAKTTYSTLHRFLPMNFCYKIRILC